VEAVMDIKKAYKEKLQYQMDEWKDEIKVLKDKIGKISADKKIKAMEEIEALQQKHKSANDKLASLKDASDTAWEDAKAGLELTWEEIKNRIISLKKYF
jgi:predicted  nucleic acid-binding Zn-ribbon protein